MSRHHKSSNLLSRKWLWLFGSVCVVGAIVACGGASALPSQPAQPEVEPTQNPHFDNLEHTHIGELPSQTKYYEGFFVSFNKDNKTPNYVGWELLGTETEGTEARTNNFWQDEELEGCPTTYDYRGSGYDRGHLCPAADQKWSEKAMTDCFVMANICPQDHDLNSKAWERLESASRTWAKRDSAIVIVAGPIYDELDTERIGTAGVRVPSAFFKALLAPYANPPRSIAFVYPNMKASGSMEDYAMTVDELEEITGYDFFHNLPDELEQAVEATTSFSQWNRK